MSHNTLSARTFNLPWLARAQDWLAGDGVDRVAGGLTNVVFLPLLGIGIFLLLWGMAAAHIETSLGQLPGPSQVWEQAGGLLDEHRAERARADDFYERLEKRVEKAQAAGKSEEQIAKIRWPRLHRLSHLYRSDLDQPDHGRRPGSCWRRSSPSRSASSAA